MLSAQLLQDYGHLFKPKHGQVLDLACGKGQNGLYLKELGIDVLFADIKQQTLDSLVTSDNVLQQDTWCADFESESQVDAMILSKMQLQGIIVFRYLHRPLFNALQQAIQPGGIVIYETFTEANRVFGRPHREQFLLKKDELKTLFKDWDVLFYFEGIKHNPNRAIAQIVCQKRQF